MLVQADARLEPGTDLVSDDDEDCYSHLVNQHERFDAVDSVDNPEDMVRTAENAEEDYRANPFSPPQLHDEER